MKGKQLCMHFVFVVVFALTALIYTVRIAAGSEDLFYQGKTIKILVNSSAGGGTDTTARLVARFLPKHLPGNPSTFVQNMPGGGGIMANNYFYRQGKPDGLELFQNASNAVAQFLRGGKRIKFDPRKYRAIASLNRGGSLLMIRKDVRHRLNDPKAKPVVVGDTDGSRNWLAMTVWGSEHLGWNIRWITGYSGTSEMVLAFRQGEIEMMSTANVNLVNELVNEQLVDIICVAGSDRRKDYPNIPTFEELLGDKRPTGVSWQAYKVWYGPSELNKFLVVHQDTPDNIVGIFRRGHEKMAQSPDFIAEANRFFGLGWMVRRGQETEALVKELIDVSKEVKEFLRGARKKRGLPTAM